MSSLIEFAEFKSKSLVWEFFLKSTAKSYLYAKCKTCDEHIKRENGSTSGMKTHMRTMHKGLMPEDVDSSSLSEKNEVIVILS